MFGIGTTKAVTRSSSIVVRVIYVIAVMTCVASPIARAENVNEFDLPEIRDLSRQASSGLLSAISTTFQALAAAEQGNTDDARGRRREALSMLESAMGDFLQIKRRMKPRTLNLKQTPMISGVEIEDIFKQHGYPMPSDTSQLAEIAINEIGLYIKAVRALEFDGHGRGRSAVFHLSVQLHRLMALGIAISQLADSAK